MRTILTSDPDLEPDERRTVAARRLRAVLLRALALGAGRAPGGGRGGVGLRRSHFVGADETTGHVDVYQGLPIDLFAGIKLYHEVSESTRAYASLDPADPQAAVRPPPAAPTPTRTRRCERGSRLAGP